MKYTYTPIGTRNSPLFEEGCLADIIKKYHRHVLKDIGRRAEFKIGFFVFYFGEHDTGTNVSVYIESPEKERRQIINCTYWNSSHYIFNRSFFESGKWDKLLEKTIDEMAERANLSIKEEKEQKERAEKEKLAKELAEKQKFESLFNE